MVAGLAASNAVRRARRLPELRIGLHIVLVEGRPALPPTQIYDLVDGGGHLRADMFRLGVDIVRRSNCSRQIAAEITAQLDCSAPQICRSIMSADTNISISIGGHD